MGGGLGGALGGVLGRWGLDVLPVGVPPQTQQHDTLFLEGLFG